jgi:hypothetical protein
MITIFCDFCQFSAKNWRFLKNQCCDQIFVKTNSNLSKKCSYFRQIFRRKYLKNHNTGPWFECPMLWNFRVKETLSLTCLHDTEASATFDLPFLFFLKANHPIPLRDSISRPIAPRRKTTRPRPRNIVLYLRKPTRGRQVFWWRSCRPRQPLRPITQPEKPIERQNCQCCWLKKQVLLVNLIINVTATKRVNKLTTY